VRIVVLTVVVLAMADAALAAKKTDVVELVNGDRITCEIRKLDRGRLTVKTDGIGTVSVEWDDVANIASAATYDIEQTSGHRLFGSLVRAVAGSVDVVSAAATERLALSSIVRISPVGGTFWSRLDGSIDGGFSFTQANVQTQWNTNASVSYRSLRWFSVLAADSSLTTREDADRQTRNTLSYQAQRFLKRHWSALGFTQFQQNEELSLNLRAVFGGGAERVLVRTNRVVFTALGGAAFTREAYAGAPDESVAEAVAGADFAWFTFDGRSTSVELSVFSFTAVGRRRERFELTSSFKSDIVSDLYWSINLFESFNSQPPAGEKRNDFGVSATVGWSF
jgi:putative salt-induced outer membrane protein YdiY